MFSKFHGLFACLRKKHIEKASIVFCNVERLLQKGPGTAETEGAYEAMCPVTELFGQSNNQGSSIKYNILVL